ncbi:MAG: FecR domain-containing protein [Candidatus Pedobacter colombiensis]|uniref:FecR domain-containing protein n=1 Tax=Candidatus Pedobacter colombiensis TaxID=3121371 RepID=A0AAJ6B5Q6_9SPHI|nr:FecR domain-containing protein [Pedobacter sp.]WEK19022.1 MAG: FecR domain-containing protein [Pedobacter sp.]
MQEKLPIQDIILSYLNQPEDPALIKQIDQLRAASEENEAYFQSTKMLWEAAAETKKLEEVNVGNSAINFKTQLNELSPVAVRKRSIWPKIAVAVVIFAAGFWMYKEKLEVHYFVKQTGSQIDSVLLSDGTKVILAENSTVQYPDKFTGDNRPITLLKGRGFFLVSKDAAHPFEISIGPSTVKVLGTSFNIDYSDRKIDVSVKTGRVMFTPNKKSAPSILVAGDAVSYNLIKNQLTQENGINSNGWLTKELHFVDMPLDAVCKELSSYYNVKVILLDHMKIAKKLNAKFSNSSIDEVLKVLKETYPIQVQQKDNNIYIKNL